MKKKRNKTRKRKTLSEHIAVISPKSSNPTKMTPSKTKRQLGNSTNKSALSFNPKRSYDSPGGFYIQRHHCGKDKLQRNQLQKLPNAALNCQHCRMSILQTNKVKLNTKKHLISILKPIY